MGLGEVQLPGLDTARVVGVPGPLVIATRLDQLVGLVVASS